MNFDTALIYLKQACTAGTETIQMTEMAGRDRNGDIRAANKIPTGNGNKL